MTDQANLLEGYITEDEYCATFDISKRTAQRARRAGKAPPHVTIHRKTWYVVDKTRQDIASQIVDPVRKSRWVARVSPELRR